MLFMLLFMVGALVVIWLRNRSFSACKAVTAHPLGFEYATVPVRTPDADFTICVPGCKTGLFVATCRHGPLTAAERPPCRGAALH